MFCHSKRLRYVNESMRTPVIGAHIYYPILTASAVSIRIKFTEGMIAQKNGRKILLNEGLVAFHMKTIRLIKSSSKK